MKHTFVNAWQKIVAFFTTIFMFLSGLIGGALLCGADILARSCAATELPVSIFTSLLGAPFLVFLIVRARRQA